MTKKNTLIHSLHDDDPDYIHPFDLAPVPAHTISRRKVLTTLGTLGALGLLIGCNNSLLTTATATGDTTDSTTTDGSNGTSTCAVIPSETDGPYPLYSSRNGIYRSNIVGSDITSTSGVPLQITLNLQNTNDSCEPITRAAVYIWHCDQYGGYSGYSSTHNGSHSGKTFCRGIQVSDNNGQVSFTTLYPGWYAGRITHIHMAIYLNNNLSSTPKISQFAFAQSVTSAVYGTSPYSSHGQNTSVTSFAADNIFNDGTAYQIATVSGSVNTSLAATLNVGMPG
jgi:protocatechuate 3,4-dioxygenase beta subunit